MTKEEMKRLEALQEKMVSGVHQACHLVHDEFPEMDVNLRKSIAMNTLIAGLSCEVLSSTRELETSPEMLREVEDVSTRFRMLAVKIIQDKCKSTDSNEPVPGIRNVVDHLVRHCPKDPGPKAGYVCAIVRVLECVVPDDVEDSDLFKFAADIRRALSRVGAERAS